MPSRTNLPTGLVRRSRSVKAALPTHSTVDRRDRPCH
jgi:hypothetical protein